jgi:5-hydroxyisourate hydrolase
MARLSTHVLDTSRGVAAAGVAIEVAIVGPNGADRIVTATTNQDGRTPSPLLAGDELRAGVYELTFFVGDYFRRAGVALTDPPFLDRVVIRVGIADPAGDYHVPLLISPYGYSTYRGT